MEHESFLGTGWGFPPRFDNHLGTVATVSGEADILESLRILLSTKPKERVMRPDFGCDLSVLMFENVTVTLLTKLKGMIGNSILLYEPRIDLIDVDFHQEDGLRGVLKIEVIYRVRATNSRKNFVFPYYLEEGTFVNP